MSYFCFWVLLMDTKWLKYSWYHYIASKIQIYIGFTVGFNHHSWLCFFCGFWASAVYPLGPLRYAVPCLDGNKYSTKSLCKGWLCCFWKNAWGKVCIFLWRVDKSRKSSEGCMWTLSCFAMSACFLSSSASKTSLLQLAKGLVLLAFDITSSLQELEMRKGQGITMPWRQALLFEEHMVEDNCTLQKRKWKIISNEVVTFGCRGTSAFVLGNFWFWTGGLKYMNFIRYLLAKSFIERDHCASLRAEESGLNCSAGNTDLTIARRETQRVLKKGDYISMMSSLAELLCMKSLLI